jgi:hypothetical protein
MKQQLPPVSEKLTHLSEEQIEELCRRYPNEKNKELIKEFEIDVYISGLVRLLPPIILENQKCLHCDIPMWQQRSKTSSYKYDPYCPECTHVNSRHCQCMKCIENKRIEKEEKKQNTYKLVKKQFGDGSYKRLLEEIESEELLYLCSFIRAADTDSCYSDIHFRNGYPKLSPNKHFDDEIIRNLVDFNLIYMISIPESYTVNIEAVEHLDSIDLFHCHFSLNIIDKQFDEQQIFKHLYYPKSFKISEQQLRDIWLKISSEECLEYIILKLDDRGIKYFYTKKHIQHIKEILLHFSVSQFYSMYLSRLKDAGYDQLKYRWSNRETLNQSIVYTLSRSESALAAGWNIPYYNRTRETRQSILSEIFFNLFLKIHKAGFYECPQTYIWADHETKHHDDHLDGSSPKKSKYISITVGNLKSDNNSTIYLNSLDKEYFDDIPPF